MSTFEEMITTRYCETAQDGIIHHSSYVLYLEQARIAHFKSMNLDINDLERSQRLSPVVDLEIKYLKPLRSLETIRVITTLRIATKVRFYFDYEIFRENTLVCRAKTSHCFIDMDFKIISHGLS